MLGIDTFVHVLGALFLNVRIIWSLRSYTYCSVQAPIIGVSKAAGEVGGGLSCKINSGCPWYPFPFSSNCFPSAFLLTYGSVKNFPCHSILPPPCVSQLAQLSPQITPPLNSHRSLLALLIKRICTKVVFILVPSDVQENLYNRQMNILKK